jgi:hypothetical protein
MSGACHRTVRGREMHVTSWSQNYRGRSHYVIDIDGKRVQMDWRVQKQIMLRKYDQGARGGP